MEAELHLDGRHTTGTLYLFMTLSGKSAVASCVVKHQTDSSMIPRGEYIIFGEYCKGVDCHNRSVNLHQHIVCLRQALRHESEKEPEVNDWSCPTNGV